MGVWFLSYARADEKLALRLADDLIDAGVRLWVDQYDIAPSEPWDNAVEAALRGADGLIVVVSPRSTASRNVADEIAIALDGDKRVIPVVIERCTLPMRLTRMQFIDASADYPGALRRCLQAIETASGAPPGTPPHVGALVRRPRARLRLWPLAAAAAVLLIAGGGALGWRSLREPLAPAPSLTSVAVLPIRNLTGDPSMDVAADRLTADVTSIFARGGMFLPATADAAAAFRGRDPQSAGRALHVANVVTASLARNPGGFQLDLEVVDPTSGRLEASHVLQVPSLAAELPEQRMALAMFEEAAGVVGARWSGDELARPPNNADPENLIARLGASDGDSPAAIANSEALISAGRTLAISDDRLRSWFNMEICGVYSRLVAHGDAPDAAVRSRWARTGLDAGAEAEALRPDASGPHVCRAELFAATGDWDDGLAEARHVVETTPLTANGYEALANIDLGRGDFADALAAWKMENERVPDCSPEEGVDGGCHGEIGLAELMLGQTEAAVAELREQSVEAPRFAWAHLFLAAALELEGRHAAAVAEADRYRSLRTDDRAWRSIAYSSAPEFAARAEIVRRALHAAGLDPPEHSGLGGTYSAPAGT